MTVRRGPLYFGVFLLAAGAVTLLVATGAVDPAAVANAMIVLWPLAIIALGVGLVLRRSPAALPAGIVAAMLPGLAFGGSVAAIPSTLPVPCTDGGAPVRQAETRSGSFGPAAAVDLTLSCGEIRVTTQPGTGWTFDAREGTNRTSNLTSFADRLVASTDGRLRAWQAGTGRVDWDVVLPTDTAIDLATTVNAGRARLDLAGARLGAARLDVNAGALEVDLAGASLDQLRVEVNAGSASVTIPADTFAADLQANAGSIEVCAPAGLGLRVNATAALGSTTLNGLVRLGDTWETPDYATAPFKADLALDASLGSIAINPVGGCK
jgi:hypothetical protein